MFDILQTVVFVALIGSFGFYLYLAGKYKGFLEAIYEQNTGLKMSRTMLLKDMKFTLHL